MWIFKSTTFYTILISGIFVITFGLIHFVVQGFCCVNWDRINFYSLSILFTLLFTYLFLIRQLNISLQKGDDLIEGKKDKSGFIIKRFSKPALNFRWKDITIPNHDFGSGKLEIESKGKVISITDDNYVGFYDLVRLIGYHLPDMENEVNKFFEELKGCIYCGSIAICNKNDHCLNCGFLKHELNNWKELEYTSEEEMIKTYQILYFESIRLFKEILNNKEVTKLDLRKSRFDSPFKQIDNWKLLPSIEELKKNSLKET